jgi:hypothetical protein
MANRCNNASMEFYNMNKSGDALQSMPVVEQFVDRKL